MDQTKQENASATDALHMGRLKKQTEVTTTQPKKSKLYSNQSTDNITSKENKQLKSEQCNA